MGCSSLYFNSVSIGGVTGPGHCQYPCSKVGSYHLRCVMLIIGPEARASGLCGRVVPAPHGKAGAPRLRTAPPHGRPARKTSMGPPRHRTSERPEYAPDPRIREGHSGHRAQRKPEERTGPSGAGGSWPAPATNWFRSQMASRVPRGTQTDERVGPPFGPQTAWIERNARR